MDTSKLFTNLENIYQDSLQISNFAVNYDCASYIEKQEYKYKAQELQKKQDLALHAELAHILCMGGLNDDEVLHFVDYIRNIGNTRSAVKVIASKDDDSPIKINNTANYYSKLCECMLTQKVMKGE